jgi:hypothetical protein
MSLSMISTATVKSFCTAINCITFLFETSLIVIYVNVLHQTRSYPVIWCVHKGLQITYWLKMTCGINPLLVTS